MRWIWTSRCSFESIHTIYNHRRRSVRQSKRKKEENSQIVVASESFRVLNCGREVVLFSNFRFVIFWYFRYNIERNSTEHQKCSKKWEDKRQRKSSCKCGSFLHLSEIFYVVCFILLLILWFDPIYLIHVAITWTIFSEHRRYFIHACISAFKTTNEIK